MSAFFSSLYAQNEITALKKTAARYNQAGNFEKAKEFYEEALKKQPWNNSIVSELNNVYVKLKDYDSSIKLLSDRIAKTPNDLTAYGLLGVTYFTIGEKEKAMEIWRKGISLNPKNEITYRIFANQALQARAFDEGIEILREGEKFAKNPNTFAFEIAQLLSYLMKYREAANEYCSILVADPVQLNMVKNRIGQFLGRSDATEETIGAVKDFLDEHPNDAVEELLAYLYSFNKDYDKAFSIVVGIDKRTGGNGTKIFHFAQSAYNSGDFQTAARSYKFLLDNYPDYPNFIYAKFNYAKSSLNYLNSASGKNDNWKPLALPDTAGSYKYDGIIKQLKELTLGGSPPYIASEAAYLLGVTLKDRYLDAKSAENYFALIPKKYPGTKFDILALYELAESAVRENNLQKALSYLNKIEKKKKVPQEIRNKTLLRKAEIAFMRGEFDGASSMLSVVASNPGDNSANDAIELSLLITALKSDSSEAVKYASARLLMKQFKINEASVILAEIADNTKNFILRDMVDFDLAEILIARENYIKAVDLLDGLTKREESALYSDKALYMIGEIYFRGLKELDKAQKIFENLLEKYPNSIYLNSSRENINEIISLTGKNL
ncbi:MAG: tetratricopeptide repeat protein [Chlorobi bacterium]|nr:tetratricopeptide repeat protein [Chlorobiota bacterium]